METLTRRVILKALMAAALLLAGERRAAPQDGGSPAEVPDPPAASPQWRDETVQKILEGARREVENGTVYYLENRYLATRYLDGVKQKKSVYPWGDIPPDIGVCTDLVIRALRSAGYDLQLRIYRDVLKDVKKKVLYPWKKWKKKHADRNNDHRRCPNQAAFFNRHADVYKVDPDNVDTGRFKPGDIVYWDLETGRFHIGIVSDKKSKEGVPLVIHSFPTPGHTAEEDALTDFRLLYGFRYPPETGTKPPDDLKFKPEPEPAP
jgi:uncharacterized protein YijF (DUF1287 family)